MTVAAEIVTLLRGARLLAPSEDPRGEPLAGGVSSDIWRIDTAQGPVCVKRALPKLKVAADWYAPVERNANEVAWIETAGRIAPGAVPKVLAHDLAVGAFAMEFLDPASYRPWKEDLRRGIADTAVAAAVGDALGRIHAGTADDPKIAARFATDAIFHAIRLEPYLLAAAAAHPRVGDALRAIVDETARTKRVLVHGDVSPKNIVVGPNGPVFLDAECAWFGDPAFDLAFCLNHFLLKCLWTPSAKEGFLGCFAAMAKAYMDRVAWEASADLEARTARLLPGLFLARVDGKSPVEYVTNEADKMRVRRLAAMLLEDPVRKLSTVSAAWRKELET